MNITQFQILVLFIIGSVSSLRGQESNFDRYQLLESVGPIPQEFLNNIEEQTKSDYKSYLEKRLDKSSTKAAKHLKHLQSFSFLHYQLMSSGKVLFGDSLTTYINEIADRLLVDKPELRSKLKFYTYKTPEFESVVLENGSILIPVGMVAQVENEAQIAFLISHSIFRFELEAQSMPKLSLAEISFFCNKPADERVNAICGQLNLNSNLYTQKADTLAFRLCAEGGYDLSDVLSTLDVIELSELPFGDHPLDFAILELDSMKFPEEMLPDSQRTGLDYIGALIGDQQNLELAIRKAKLVDFSKKFTAGSNSSKTGVSNHVSRIIKISRYESTHEQLIRGQFIEALYSAYLMALASPNDAFAEESLAKALYGCCKSKTYGEYPSESLNETFYEGEYAFSGLIKNLTLEQLRFISVRYLLNVYNKYSNPFIEQLLNDLIIDIQKEDKMSWETIVTKVEKIEATLLRMNSTLAAPIKQDSSFVSEVPATNFIDNTGETSSKYEKLRKSRKEEFASSNQPDTISSQELLEVFHYRAFSNSLSKNLQERFELSNSKIARKEKSIQRAGRYIKHEYTPYLSSKGDSLGIENMLIVIAPLFTVPVIESGKNLHWKNLQYAAQEESTSLSKKYNMTNNYVQTILATEEDIELVQNSNILANWFCEYQNLNQSKIHMIPLQTEYIIPICKQYHSTHVAFTHIYNRTNFDIVFEFNVFDLGYEEVVWRFGIETHPLKINAALPQFLERSIMQCSRKPRK